MRAGKLNSRVSLLAQSTTPDTIGQPVRTWTSYVTVWADIRVQGGLETIKNDATTSVIKASIRIRRRTDVTAGHRVQHGAKLYNIQAVLPDESSRQHVDLVCELQS